jgi:hypothetical protein
MTFTELPPPRREWEPLPPERVPRPTYFPAGMALGAALLFWGIIASWVILLVGFGLFTFTLGGWIAEILYERKQS